MRMDGEFNVEGPQPLEPFVTTVHPLTNEPILLRDPAYQVVDHGRNGITADTAASFAAVVASVTGANKLIELRTDGKFVYRNALLGCVAAVGFDLQASPTAKVLALDHGFSCTQKQLLQWKDQWPGTLVPLSNAPEATFAAIGGFKVEKATSINANYDEGSVSLALSQTNGDNLGIIPLYWNGVSPLFDGHAAQTVTLRMEVKVPEIDGDGKVAGALEFSFGLWSPAPSQVRQDAMDDAAERMAALLPAFEIIRGKIA